MTIAHSRGFRGARPLPPGVAKHFRIAVPVSLNEKKAILRAASRAGVGIAEWLRGLAAEAIRAEATRDPAAP